MRREPTVSEGRSFEGGCRFRASRARRSRRNTICNAEPRRRGGRGDAEASRPAAAELPAPSSRGAASQSSGSGHGCLAAGFLRAPPCPPCLRFEKDRRADPRRSRRLPIRPRRAARRCVRRCASRRSRSAPALRSKASGACVDRGRSAFASTLRPSGAEDAQERRHHRRLGSSSKASWRRAPDASGRSGSTWFGAITSS